MMHEAHAETEPSPVNDTLEECLSQYMGRHNVNDDTKRMVEYNIEAFFAVNKRLPVGIKRYLSEWTYGIDDRGTLSVMVVLKHFTPDQMAIKVKEACGPNIGVFVEESDC